MDDIRLYTNIYSTSLDNEMDFDDNKFVIKLNTQYTTLQNYINEFNEIKKKTLTNIDEYVNKLLFNITHLLTNIVRSIQCYHNCSTITNQPKHVQCDTNNIVLDADIEIEDTRITLLIHYEEDDRQYTKFIPITNTIEKTFLSICTTYEVKKIVVYLPILDVSKWISKLNKLLSIRNQLIN